MGRTAKPWFYRQTGWWMVWLNGRKVKLAKGSKAKKAADERLLELRFEVAVNPAPAGADQTVASVIDAYLEYAGKRLAELRETADTDAFLVVAIFRGEVPLVPRGDDLIKQGDHIAVLARADSMPQLVPVFQGRTQPTER